MRVSSRLVGAVSVLAVLTVVAVVRWLPRPTNGPLSATGTIEVTEITISSEVMARIVRIPVEEGQAVQAGDVLVQLDDSLAQLQYRQADPVEQRLLRLELDKYTLRAPRAGVVLRRSAEPGEVAMVGAPLMVIADLSAPKVTVYVPQRELGRVHLGQSVVVEADALPGVTFPGVVERVADQAEFTPRTVQTENDRLNLVFGVTVRISGSNGQLRPGMTATVRFTG